MNTLTQLEAKLDELLRQYNELLKAHQALLLQSQNQQIALTVLQEQLSVANQQIQHLQITARPADDTAKQALQQQVAEVIRTIDNVLKHMHE